MARPIGLIGISFIYGIFHVAGPGHGKAVISSYLIANEETWRRGIALSFAAALLQACTAIAIVGVAALILGATARMDGRHREGHRNGQLFADRAVGRAAVPGLKGKSFLHAWRAFRAAGGAAAAGTEKHSHHAHAAHAHQAHEIQAHDVLTAASYVHAAHDHCEHHAHEAHSHEEHADETHEQHEHVLALAVHAHHDFGSAHVTLSAPPLTAPRKAEENAHGIITAISMDTTHRRTGTRMSTTMTKRRACCLGATHTDRSRRNWPGPGGWRRGLSAIVAVGSRPCSGAIIVLVFALSQGLYWAGVASTLVMALGTAITVSSIASLAVGARSVAKRLAASRPGYASLILRGGEARCRLFGDRFRHRAPHRLHGERAHGDVLIRRECHKQSRAIALCTPNGAAYGADGGKRGPYLRQRA